ncbi:hypothetical protein IQ06DRAFT_297703 [Phaeosphaeriaceae sp. SRC1lsM3a]|nr:hypothetical protein IQ06DRAFT_297703 [Stagonospora sp. SRC1lsM3a]
MGQVDNTSQFLELPVEIRLNIYGFVELLNPLEHPTKALRSLQDSCLFVQNEIQSEMLMRMAQSVRTIANKIRERGDEIEYTPQTTVIGWLNLTVSRRRIASMFTVLDPFLEFSRLHFKSLRITLHEYQGCKDFEPFADTFVSAALTLGRTIRRWHKKDRPVALGCWILDWSAYPERSNARISCGKGSKGSRWTTDLWLDQDRWLTGVRFYEIGR